jgi:hypothetical protein
MTSVFAPSVVPRKDCHPQPFQRLTGISVPRRKNLVSKWRGVSISVLRLSTRREFPQSEEIVQLTTPEKGVLKGSMGSRGWHGSAGFRHVQVVGHHSLNFQTIKEWRAAERMDHQLAVSSASL